MEYIQDKSYALIGFAVIIIGLLAVDLFVFNKEAHKVSTKEALYWSMVWIGIGLLFGGYIYLDFGLEKASDYYAAFIIEKALSVDNLFVFILVFKYFKVPDKYQHKVLFYGILGAIILRAMFIFFGVALIELTFLPTFSISGYDIKINVILTIFGFFLIYAGIKTFGQSDEDDASQDFSQSLGTKLIHKIFRVDNHYHGDKFFVNINGKRFATQLLVVVAVIEFTDLLFAVDSIPAIFAISNDPVILYTSNIFAILGLRSLYFLLANSFDMFHYLHYGLSFILGFVGFKMLVSAFYHPPAYISLTIIISILAISILASLKRYKSLKKS
ncbi:TerC/Alx family metal homeostasis membrane protein [Belliella kenyensis]|uniref:TerC/Alx family metal homeostasis membrane protein n=1 Tax=Belliella kenyensis TaxID=1472724 RepID=A0ABV8ELV2_9BACT|nr:TerC/Alx family metal homeostasis membrane protein [Belliella kenyensis]MCH7400501.1 TerC/Alx family metal homeostasis membrane protein [Belliella kenyensis]MDN3604483.1 TerC/Alx family metal homeostasis membrane protein [Belliella kenyensis]